MLFFTPGGGFRPHMGEGLESFTMIALISIGLALSVDGLNSRF